MTMQADDMAAINDYFNRQPGKTQAAKDAKASWAAWWKGLSFISKSFTGSTLEEATKRRISFDAANGEVARQNDGGLTPEEQKYFANMPSVDVTGLTPEAAKAKVADANKKVTVSPPASLLAVTYGTIRQGSKGDAVKKWQTILGIKPIDGNFGPATTTATIAWQKAHAIKADGNVGPATWTAALGTSEKAKEAVTDLLVAAVTKPTPAASAQNQNFDINNAVAQLNTPVASKPAVTQNQIPAPGTQGTPVLRLGSTGEEVKQWQAILGITQSGIFDDATKKATLIWQANHNLVTDGVVGASTWTAAKSVTPSTAVAAATQGLQNAQVQVASFLGGGLTKLPTAAKWALGTVALGSILGAIWYARQAPTSSRSY
jgi:peptidoglycan hydrolase-like protein with peptidoglycan-binding domain